MSDHISEPCRQLLMHISYMKYARERLLSQFNDIEADADLAVEEWRSPRHQMWYPLWDNAKDFLQAAKDVRDDHRRLLTDMRTQTRLSVVAGMFHEWDKQLRDWLVHEIGHWHRGDNAVSKIWAADFSLIIGFLESFGWNLRGTDYFHTLDACRLVVNVYKHGQGRSLDELRSHCPEYLDDPFFGAGAGFSPLKYHDHTDLSVSEDQVRAFSDAILAFWRDLPKNVLASQITNVPEWFMKAILKDRAEAQRANGGL